MAEKIKFRTRNLFPKLNSEDRSGFVMIRTLKNLARIPIPEMETYLKYGFVITEH